ncbi:MAG: TetR/AcrR family transcriptional regulator [Acidobacteriaceae bacterium]|nr:TetR/AcrR family transcriptional regulator [Acidobacteriaceae bacterium]
MSEVQVNEPVRSGGAREKILRGAMRVFLEDGYDSVSMDRMAEAAGVARRTLYNQFPEGKEAVFRAAIELFWQGFPQVTWSEDAVADPEGSLREVAMAIASFWAAEEMVPYVRLAIAESTRFPGLMQHPGDNSGRLPLMEQLMEWLRLLDRKEILRVPNAELAMWQFFGLVTEPLVWPRVIGIQVPMDDAYRNSVIEGAAAAMMKLYAR